jgi:hypothetical protein
MSNKWVTSCAVLLTVAGLVGCSANGDDSSKADRKAAKAQANRAEAIPVPIPATSKFAQVELGMSRGEVEAKLGEPDEFHGYVTGKAWNPFYYGGDTHRMAARYKGEGVIVYSPHSRYASSYKVIRIEYNPDEPGYR